AAGRNLLEPACHLPHPWPEEFSLEGEELFVVVALLGDAVGGLDRPRNRKRCPVHFGQWVHPLPQRWDSRSASDFRILAKIATSTAARRRTDTFDVAVVGRSPNR